MNASSTRTLLSIVIGASVAIAAIGAWYLITPSRTVRAMAAAAADGDGDALASYMDMGALRRDARLSASRALRRNVPSGEVVLDHRAVTEVLLGPVIDRIFSPAGARALARSADPDEVATVAYRIVRDGPNRFVARIEGGRPVDLAFTRHGLGWKLSGIRMRSNRRGPQAGPIV